MASCSVGVSQVDVVIVPHFFACSSHRPERLDAPYWAAVHIFAQ